MSITVLDVMAAARSRRAFLVGETVAYLVLAVADQMALAPRRVAPEAINITEDGDVWIASPVACSSTESQSDLQALLAKLLLASRAAAPALVRVSTRAHSGGVAGLVKVLEAALVPINRAAGRRALSRLFRETEHAMSRAEFDPLQSEPAPSRGRHASSRVEAGSIKHGELAHLESRPPERADDRPSIDASEAEDPPASTHTAPLPPVYERTQSLSVEQPLPGLPPDEDNHEEPILATVPLVRIGATAPSDCARPPTPSSAAELSVELAEYIRATTSSSAKSSQCCAVPDLPLRVPAVERIPGPVAPSRGLGLDDRASAGLQECDDLPSAVSVLDVLVEPKRLRQATCLGEADDDLGPSDDHTAGADGTTEEPSTPFELLLPSMSAEEDAQDDGGSDPCGESVPPPMVWLDRHEAQCERRLRPLSEILLEDFDGDIDRLKLALQLLGRASAETTSALPDADADACSQYGRLALAWLGQAPLGPLCAAPAPSGSVLFGASPVCQPVQSDVAQLVQAFSVGGTRTHQDLRRFLLEIAGLDHTPAPPRIGGTPSVLVDPHLNPPPGPPPRGQPELESVPKRLDRLEASGSGSDAE